MINERSFNIRAVQIGGATGFLTMQLVDCFEESWAEENQVASIGRLLSKERALVQLCYTARGFHQGFKGCVRTSREPANCGFGKAYLSG
jgi:hypothetical protein